MYPAKHKLLQQCAFAPIRSPVSESSYMFIEGDDECSRHAIDVFIVDHHVSSWHLTCTPDKRYVDKFAIRHRSLQMTTKHPLAIMTGQITTATYIPYSLFYLAYMFLPSPGLALLLPYSPLTALSHQSPPVNNQPCNIHASQRRCFHC